ncbi:MAG: glycosyltransferase [Planctomycetota bacterium]
MILVVEIAVLVLLIPEVLLWALFFIESRRSFLHDPRIDPRRNQLAPGEFPHVTVCIPARNEEDNIAGCLESVLSIDYPDFDVVVVDDRSTDRTGEIADSFAARDSRLRVIHNRELPPEWVGKAHALHLASRIAGGSWLLFVDADTRHHPQCLRACLREAFDHAADAVAPFCAFDVRSFWEAVVMPTCAGFLVSRYRVRDTNRRSSPTGFLNGQFFLVKRETYEAIGGHQAVRGYVQDDIVLVGNIKKAGKRLRVGYGPEIVRVRMFGSVPAMVGGWSRIFFGAFGARPWRLVGMIGQVGFAVFFPLLVLILGAACLSYGHAGAITGVNVALSAAALLLGILNSRYANLATGVRGWYAVFLPVGAVLLLAVLWGAFMLATGRRRLQWRGDYLAADQMPLTPVE